VKPVFILIWNVTGDVDALLSRIMDENAVPSDIMDDEYYMYANEGMSDNIYDLYGAVTS